MTAISSGYPRTWEIFLDPPKIQRPKPMGSRAGQKNTAAKLFCSEIQKPAAKAWQVDQSRMASPIQGSVHSKAFLQNKTKVIPLDQFVFSGPWFQ